MNIKNRDHARAEIKRAGITSDNVTNGQLSRLWHCLAPKLRNSGNYNGSYAMNPPVATKFMTCRTGQWERREAISFNPDGFIGFAGWADNSNAQPILDGVGEWLEKLPFDPTIESD